MDYKNEVQEKKRQVEQHQERISRFHSALEAQKPYQSKRLSDKAQKREARLNRLRDSGKKFQTTAVQGEEALKGKYLAIHLVSEMVAVTVFSYFIGLWLDRLFRTDPYLMILCLCLGWIGIILQIIRIVQAQPPVKASTLEVSLKGKEGHCRKTVE